jgi:hypothetical protein
VNLSNTPTLSETEERRRGIVRGLGFAVELLHVFQGGVRLRDSGDFPDGNTF